jgi:hypothetical protein
MLNNLNPDAFARNVVSRSGILCHVTKERVYSNYSSDGVKVFVPEYIEDLYVRIQYSRRTAIAFFPDCTIRKLRLYVSILRDLMVPASVNEFDCEHIDGLERLVFEESPKILRISGEFFLTGARYFCLRRAITVTPSSNVVLRDSDNVPCPTIFEAPHILFHQWYFFLRGNPGYRRIASQLGDVTCSANGIEVCWDKLNVCGWDAMVTGLHPNSLHTTTGGESCDIDFGEAFPRGDLYGTIVLRAGCMKNLHAKTVTLPPLFCEIESLAFFTASIFEVIIPWSVVVIKAYSFSKTPLIRLVFERSSQLSRIEMEAFSYTKLSSIVFPGSLTYIAPLAFQSNLNLSSVTFLPENPLDGDPCDVNPCAFFGCSSELTVETYRDLSCDQLYRCKHPPKIYPIIRLAPQT